MASPCTAVSTSIRAIGVIEAKQKVELELEDDALIEVCLMKLVA
jgi:hypothetical protein